MSETEPGTFLMGDELKRKRLVAMGVHAADWETLHATVQNRIKASLHGLRILEVAIGAAATPEPDGRTKRARDFLRRFNEWIASEERRKSSFAFRGFRVEKGNNLHAAYAELKEYLTRLKARGRTHFFDATWSSREADGVNRLLERGVGSLSVRSVCRGRDVECLGNTRPAELAAVLLKRAYGGVVKDELLRGKTK